MPAPNEPVNFGPIFKCVLAVILGVVTITGFVQFSSIKKAEIELEREQKIQAQETERTEERSQFWQKLIP